MKHISYKDVEPVEYNNEAVKGVSGRVLIGKADGADNFCMRFFELAPGGNTPKHSHEWEHEVFIHSGSGEVLCDGAWKPVVAGDALFVPGNEPHQFRNAGEAPFSFVCIIPAGPPEL